ncbi:DHA2 family efflux MFS transporter permease subunit [Acinetobacter rudis]|uniref:MFS transporter, DHA2 family, multidrug resistance protein B n=1 Tax=Acinetobacter rudis CIP 110305 TaxID=421052 RepID=S3MXG1_9GAMM|nr:DHA2 family efflux MFS transporter permease subunit [Acinetobacter rudis]EPF71088.1 MFS transporter, DHA2 family, multidrug resistance protein B [Acinetobacter rudis CIP 110305]
MNNTILKTNLKGIRLLIAAFIVALANFMVVLDMTIANVSLPTITGSLAISTSQGTWIITSYAIAEAIGLCVSGWIAQRFGLVRSFSIALMGFTVFSICCGLSNSLELLVMCRVGQGLFGGPIMPLSQTLIISIFPQEKYIHALGIWAATTVLGPILGPILGGIISENWAWNWIFLINVPIGFFLIYGVYLFLSKIKSPLSKSKFDVIGMIFLLVWVGALQMMLDMGHDYDWFNHPKIWVLAMITLIVFSLFLAWELTGRQPIIQLHIFANKSFCIATLALSVAYGAFFGGIVVIPQWLQLNMGYTATWAGYLMATMGVGSLLMSVVVAKLIYWIDQRLLVSIGFIVFALSCYLRTDWANNVDFIDLAWPQILQGFALPFFFIPLSNIALAAVQSHELAMATGMMNFIRTLSGAIGASISMSLWSNYSQIARHEMVARIQMTQSQHALLSAHISQQNSLELVSNVVDHEAMTISINHIFWGFSLIFILISVLIWLLPKPQNMLGQIHLP